MSGKYFTIAIDGPSGVGKSTLAKGLAKRLGIMHLDTGAMYRALGLASLRSNLDSNSMEDAKKVLAANTVSISFFDGSQRTYLNDEDITDQIRTPQVSMAASNISKFPDVRQYLLKIQRDLASRESFILEGRDTGTVILPDADLKIFLTASPETRVERRYKELLARGDSDVDLKELIRLCKERDEQDAKRDIAPTRQAEDAYLLNSDNLNIEETIEQALSFARQKGIV